MPETAILFRGFERLIIELFAGGSLFLGWHLFSVGRVSKQTGEFAFKDWRISLQKVGPGIFFALFGALILIIGLFKPLELGQAPLGDVATISTPETAHNKQVNLSYFGDNSAPLKWAQAINTIEDISKTWGGQIQSPTDRILHAKAIEQLGVVRKQLMMNAFGKKLIQEWDSQGEDYLLNPDNVPADLRTKFDGIRPWSEPIP